MKHIFEWNKLKKLISFRFAFILLFLLGTYLFLISKPYNLNMASVIRDITVLSEIKVPAGSLQQGILDSRQQTTDNRQQTTDNRRYSSNHRTLTMFDHDWNIVKTGQMKFDGISRPHIGILSWSDTGNILAGIIDLDAYEKRESNTRVVLINPNSFRVEKTYDFSLHSRYVDAIVQYQGEFWISYKNFITVYAVNEFGTLEEKRKYKIVSGTAQGLRVTKDGLYVVAENNLVSVRGLPNGIYRYPFDSLYEYDETLWSNILSTVESLASSIDYYFDIGVINRFFKQAMNYPDVIWGFGFPAGNPDNEGFSFDTQSIERNIIWISDVKGDTARRILLN